MSESFWSKIKGLLPESKRAKKSEEQRKNREERLDAEAKRSQPNKTFDATFVRRFVDKDGVLTEEYDFGKPLGEDGDKGALVRWEANKPAGFSENNQIAKTQPGGELVKYGPLIMGDKKREEDNAIQKRVPRQIGAGDKGLVPRGEQALVKRGGQGLVPRGEQGLARVETPKIPDAPENPFSTEKRSHRVVVADITPIVDRYAKTLAEKKLSENIQEAGFNFLKKAVYRLAEDGYTDEKVGKYFLEAKQEILNNRNLLALIQTKLARKSEGVPLKAGDDDIHNEILDNIIESFDKGILDEARKSQEVKAEHVDLGAAQNARIDAAGADLVVKWCLGSISDKKTFDAQVEQTIVPLLEKAGAKQGESRMYANNLLEMAEGYKKEIQEKLKAVGQEFGPEQKKNAEIFIRGSLHLDIMLGEKGADLYQKSSADKMKGYEKYVDWVQKGSVLSSKIIGGKASRMVGRVLSNPLLYAAGGSMLTRAAAKSAGMAVGTGIGIASGIAFMPATLAIVGSGVAAGLYMRARATRERRRDIERRQQETVMGLREGVEGEGVAVDQWRAEKLIKELEALQAKAEQLTLEEKQYVGQIQSRLDLQAKQGVDLIGVAKETHEKFRGKFVAEHQLRKALMDFWQKKGLEYGGTPQEQLAAYNRFKSEAIPNITAEINAKNQEQAEEIRKYANKVGLVGGGMAMLGAALAPLGTQMVERGMNHFLGTHFDVNKVTYFQELGHKIKELSGHGHPEGVYAGTLFDQAPSGVNVKINLPPGFSTIDQGMDHGNHLIAIVDSHGNVVPGGDHLPFDADGNLADPNALDSLQQHGWLSHTEAGVAGHAGSSGAYSEAELRADGFEKNVRADWHHIKDWDTEKKILFNGKELQAYKTVAGGGDENWDVAKMLNNLSDNAEHASLLREQFGIDTEGHVDTQMQALRDQITEWYRIGGKAEIAKHLVMRVIADEHSNKVTGLSKVIGSFDEHGHLNLAAKYAHAAYKEIGLRDESGQFHILATDKTGSEMVHDAVGNVGGKQAVLDLYSPEPHGTEVGYAAGYKRDTDKDLDKQKRDAAEKKRKEEEAKAKAIEQKKAQELEAKHKAEVERAEKNKKAKEEIIAKYDSKQFNEKAFNEIAEKYGSDKEELAQSILEAKGVDVKAQKAEAMKAAKEAGIAEPTNLELYLLMLKMTQAGYEAKKNSPPKVVSIEEGKKAATTESSESEDGDSAEDIAAAKAQTIPGRKPKKAKAKVVPISTAENAADDSSQDDAEEAPKNEKVEGAGKAKYQENIALLRATSKNRVHFDIPKGTIKESQWKKMASIVARIEKVIRGLNKEAFNKLINNPNKGETSKARQKGLIIEFSANGGQPVFKGDKLQLSSDASEQDLRSLLETKFGPKKTAKDRVDALKKNVQTRRKAA